MAWIKLDMPLDYSAESLNTFMVANQVTSEVTDEANEEDGCEEIRKFSGSCSALARLVVGFWSADADNDPDVLCHLLGGLQE